MILKQFTLGPIEDNNYLLIDEESKEAVLIDCTEKSEEVFKAIDESNAKLKYILLTHGHFDHVLGVNDFKAKYPETKVLIHEEDKIMLEKMAEFGRSFNLGNLDAQNADGILKDGEILTFGQNEIKVIHTPGHTKGGACFLVGDKIFTGDTLFYLSVGRTDLPGGSFATLKSSIEQKLFALEDDITVYPGHGQSSTIGFEKQNNQFL